MTLSRKELKENAKEKLKGNWGEPIATTAIYLAISFGASMIVSFILGLIVGLISGLIGVALENTELINSLIDGASSVISFVIQLFLAPLTVGFLAYFLSFTRNDEDKSLTKVFEGYKKSFGTSMLAMLLQTIYIFLWTLLLIVPGIIKVFSYAMVEYIIADDSTISATDAIKKSQEMMKGHKWEFCVLQLSFLGWGILALFTCGIGFLWLNPYMQTAITNFYLQIKEEYELKLQAV